MLYKYIATTPDGEKKNGSVDAPNMEIAVRALQGRNLIVVRSEEHTSELQSHSFISYAVFCLKKKIQSHSFISYAVFCLDKTTVTFLYLLCVASCTIQYFLLSSSA